MKRRWELAPHELALESRNKTTVKEENDEKMKFWGRGAATSSRLVENNKLGRQHEELALRMLKQNEEAEISCSVMTSDGNCSSEDAEDEAAVSAAQAMMEADSLIEHLARPPKIRTPPRHNHLFQLDKTRSGRKKKALARAQRLFRR